MTPIQSCMGGWCTRRGHCAHYHAASSDQTPAERLCPPGHDGKGLQMLLPNEEIDMPRDNYMRIDDRIAQIKPLLKPEGTTRKAISDAIGVHTRSALSRIMDLTVAKGAAFATFARVSTTMKTAEMVYFPTAADRDAFRAAYDAGKPERDKARQQRRSRESYERHCGKIAAQRKAEREAASAQREALKAAERELANQRKRLDREARAAEKARAKVEAKKQQNRLKAETKAAGRLVFKAGTEVARSKKPTFAELPVLNPNGVEPKKIPSNLRDRFAAETAPSVISSNDCREWAKAAA